MVIRLPEVKKITGLPRSTIYRYIKQNNFPKQVPLGNRSVGWIREEVLSWVTEKITQRNSALSA